VTRFRTVELYLHSFTRREDEKEMEGEEKGGIERRGGQEGEDGGRG
jgi:hypothetical protein